MVSVRGKRGSPTPSDAKEVISTPPALNTDTSKLSTCVGAERSLSMTRTTSVGSMSGAHESKSALVKATKNVGVFMVLNFIGR